MTEQRNRLQKLSMPILCTALMLFFVAVGLLTSQPAQAKNLALPAVSSSLKLTWSSKVLTLAELNAGADGQVSVNVAAGVLKLTLPAGVFFASSSTASGGALSYNAGTPAASNQANITMSGGISSLNMDLSTGVGSGITFQNVNQPTLLYLVDIKSSGALTMTQLMARDRVNAVVGRIASGNLGAVNLTAPITQLYGANGIGTAGAPLGTQTATTEMNTNTGSIYAANTGDLSLGIVNTSPNTYAGVQVKALTGAYVVDLSTTGLLAIQMISETIKAPGSITVTTGTGFAGGCMIYGTNLPAIWSLNGKVTLTATSGNIQLGRFYSNLRYYSDLTGKGLVLSAPNGSIIVDYVTYLTSTGGLVDLSAGTAVRVLKSGGYSGATFYTMGVTPVNINTPLFEMNSGGAIASSSAPMTITVDTAIISGTIRAPSRVLWLRPRTAGRRIDLGLGTMANAIGLKYTEVAYLDASGGTVRYGGPDAGAIYVTSSITRTGTAKLWLDSPSTITQAANARIVNNNLRISSPNATLNQKNTGTTTTLVDGVLTLNRVGGPTLSGSLVVGDGNGLPGSAVVQMSQNNQFLTTGIFTVYGDGKLMVNGNKQSVAALAAGVLAGGTANTNAQIDLGGGVMTTTHTTVVTFPGLISGAGTLIKTGTGTLTLSNNNTFGSLDMRAGKVVVNGTTPTSVILSSGILGGTGAVGRTIVSGGSVEPGLSPGIFTTTQFTLNAPSVLKVEITGVTPGSGYDQLRVTDGVTLTDATLTIVYSMAAAMPDGQVFTLINNMGTHPVSGTFIGLPEGSKITLGGKLMTLNYGHGDGNDVTLTAPGAISYYPTYVPGDAVVSGGALTQGTPFAVYATVTGLSGTCTGPKLYYPSTAASEAFTWNNNTWVLPGDAWSAFAAVDATSGSWSGWVVGAIPASAPDTGSISVGIHCYDDQITSPVVVTKMTMSAAGIGAWLDETDGTNRAGRAVVVKNGTTIVGLYIAEDNGVSEGYSGSAGYYKVGIPEGSNYTVESWNLITPGTAVDKINTMGIESCDNAATAGAVTSFNACTTPTAVKLQSLYAGTPLFGWMAVLPGLALGTAGWMIASRRRR